MRWITQQIPLRVFFNYARCFLSQGFSAVQVMLNDVLHDITSSEKHQKIQKLLRINGKLFLQVSNVDCCHTPVLTMIRFPDRDPNGFCDSEPDSDQTGFRKNSTGSDMDIQTALITAVKCLIRVFFGYKPIGSNIWTVLSD